MKLTLRQSQIHMLLNAGMSNKEIAATLNIEIDTVKSHVSHILRKLNVSNRVEAAMAWKEKCPHCGQDMPNNAVN